MDPHAIGKGLLLLALLLAVLGLSLLFLGRIPFLGRLPGDLLIQKKNITFYFPLATCLVVSFLITLISHLLNRR